MTEPIIITGCQRSGTTLLNLILDSHPCIGGLEETYFRRYFTVSKLQKALDEQAAPPILSIKLPMQSHMLHAIIEALPKRTRVVWLVRDPRAVVASMVNLHQRVTPLRFSELGREFYPQGDHQCVAICTADLVAAAGG